MAQKTSAVNLDCDTIKDLDSGSMGLVIDAALKAAIRDVEDRGLDGQARVVTIKISLKSIGGAIKIDAKVNTTIPPYATKPTIAVIANQTGVPQAMFQPETPANPHQEEIPFGDK